MRKSIGTVYLLVSLAVALVFLIAVIVTARYEENQYAQLQLSAARTMADAEAFLKARIMERGIEVEPEDLNQTYLLGPEFTELTSTPGAADAKRTSWNPNFAAAMVRYFSEAGLEKGDVLAIGTSGSFPGLAVAAVIAASRMGLETRIIASLGASMHGATRPEFNIFDFLLCLKEGGFADFNLVAVSRGGFDDKGGGVLEGILYEGTDILSAEICRDVASRTGAAYIECDTLAESIRRRLELFGDGIDMFVNVGGASTNSGASSYGTTFPPGLVLTPPQIPADDTRGLCFEYAAQGLPVLNLLSVKVLASENGIAYDPVPMSKPGDGGVYTTTHYSVPLIVAGITTSVCVLLAGFVVSYMKRKGH